MTPSDDEFDLRAETTEQALARVEAECDWSDVGRFADAIATVRAAPAADDARRDR
ncbi:MAG: hypothetical protein O9345_05250 [Burkholderiaceae bacterium]|jgi:mannose-1-phosphate guanylyltransferase|nr:hypothetical protein [Burkholderiales bacterium]MCZ8099166.1 hypothetical protein [Burkholderiales bacterium]MCZ8337551.1 hypothetical protein [Burkholderiaceae bacterium]